MIALLCKKINKTDLHFIDPVTTILPVNSRNIGSGFCFQETRMHRFHGRLFCQGTHHKCVQNTRPEASTRVKVRDGEVAQVT